MSDQYKRLSDGYQMLKAERDTLAKELAEVRAENADIRADLRQDDAERLAAAENQNAVISELRAQLDAALARVAEADRQHECWFKETVLQRGLTDSTAAELAAALAENERLRAEAAQTLEDDRLIANDAANIMDAYHEDIQKLEAQLHAAVAALRKYGKHVIDHRNSDIGCQAGWLRPRRRARSCGGGW